MSIKKSPHPRCYFAGGNGINQSFVNDILVIAYTGDTNNYTVAAQAANKLGGNGDVNKIAAAIEKVYSGTSGGSIKVGNITIAAGGRTVHLTWEN
ncbi:hypothetical protein GN156_15045 [bacterium LRH843]|nr:hypothetical protein [bacterium LRH843]